MTYKTPKPTSSRLQLPVGVSGAEPDNVPVGALAYASDTDLVRVKTSLGWADVGAGGAGVTEIAEGTLIEVTDPTGPTATVAVAPFGTLSQLTTPATTDRLVIEDASASFAKKYIEWGDIDGVQTVAAGSGIAVATGGGPTATVSIAEFDTNTQKTSIATDDRFLINDSAASDALKYTTFQYLRRKATGNPFIDVPATAWSDYDDEFDSGSADLATRGWTVYNGSGTTMTRSGDVQNAAPALSSTTYRSTIVGSCIFIQLHGSAAMNIDKYAAMGAYLSTKGTVVVRAGRQTQDSAFSSLCRVTGNAGTDLLVPATRKRVLVDTSFGGGVWRINNYADAVGSPAYWDSSFTIDRLFDGDIYWMAHTTNDPSASGVYEVRSTLINSSSMGSRSNYSNGSVNQGQWNCTGLVLTTGASGGVGGPQGSWTLFCVDYIRFSTEYGKWFY